MSDTLTNTAILWEYDKPQLYSGFLNYSAGIWFWTLTPGIVTVTDDNGNTGYYEDQNTSVYKVGSVMVDDTYYLEVSTLADMYTQDECFYYDMGSSKLYIAFENWTKPLAQQIYIGIVAGFSKNLTDQYLNNTYYESRLKNVFGIKKSKDPLFYGKLAFQKGTVKLINDDGGLDDWRDKNLFRQATRVLIGQNGDPYSSYTKIFSGIIGNDSRNWSELSVSIEDVRAGLSTPMPYNELLQDDYPNLSSDGLFKPIAYGDITGGICVCLNEEDESASYYTFLFMDTEFNEAYALTEVRVDGTAVVPYSSDLAAGTFVLTSAQVDSNFSEVFCDFTGANIKNGVDIIKNLMLNYADTSYIAANYDLTEVAAAQAIARNTSAYYNKQTELNKIIEQLCVDIDALFFAKDDGKYTVRIYDEDREPVKTIYFDEWIGEPDIDNNADEFLSSVIIGYKKNYANDTTTKYNETSYEDEVFETYKSLQSKEITTCLTTEADAILKAHTVMETSKFVQDIVKRNTGFQHIDLEIMDFIICDPRRRFSGEDRWGIWEIIGISKDPDTLTIQLTLRYIKSYSPGVIDYGVLIDESGNYIIDESGNTIAMR